MGISVKDVRRFNAVQIISKIDDAIDHEASDWEKYEDDPIGNMDALKFLPNKKPTIFLCNFELSAKDDAKIQDAMFGGIDEDKNPKPAFGNWALAVAKYTLKAIENPPETNDPILFKTDAKKAVSDETLNILQKAGIIQEIFNHYIKLTKTEVGQNAKK